MAPVRSRPVVAVLRQEAALVAARALFVLLRMSARPATPARAVWVARTTSPTVATVEVAGVAVTLAAAAAVTLRGRHRLVVVAAVMGRCS